MWLVRWFGREDPGPRRRWLESECATFPSASGLAKRLALGDATRISIKRIAEGAGRVPAPAVVDVAPRVPDHSAGVVVEAKDGVCRQELLPGWCSLCG
ncbi:MAG: hypothetical protein M3285_01075 [Actinomycetota bacterium]|nr:hypothetical protein [Actinomycetota bacterium]MDQ3954128.1 hypothetical protein [Actinomycetota bacterium]